MKIEINKLTPGKVEVGFLKKVAEKTTKLVKLKLPELSIVLVCDRRMKGFNKKYLKRNWVTDVLAFDYGEIIICLPQAKRQAKRLGHSLKKELAILLVHGILHLVGFDDEKPREYDKMIMEQDKIIKKIWRNKT